MYFVDGEVSCNQFTETVAVEDARDIFGTADGERHRRDAGVREDPQSFFNVGVRSQLAKTGHE